LLAAKHLKKVWTFLSQHSSNWSSQFPVISLLLKEKEMLHSDKHGQTVLMLFSYFNEKAKCLTFNNFFD